MFCQGAYGEQPLTFPVSCARSEAGSLKWKLASTTRTVSVQARASIVESVANHSCVHDMGVSFEAWMLPSQSGIALSIVPYVTLSWQATRTANVVYPNTWHICIIKLVRIVLRGAFSRLVSRINWRGILSHLFNAIQK